MVNGLDLHLACHAYGFRPADISLHQQQPQYWVVVAVQLTPANSNQNDFPLDFPHTFTIILPFFKIACYYITIGLNL